MCLVKSKTTKSRYSKKTIKKKIKRKKLLKLAAHTDEMINVKNKNESNFLKTVFRINKKTKKKSVSRITRVSTNARDPLLGKY